MHPPCLPSSQQVDTATRNPDSVKQGYLLEVPVQKWSRADQAFKSRLLALTKSSVVEMDVATRSVSIKILFFFFCRGFSHSWFYRANQVVAQVGSVGSSCARDVERILFPTSRLNVFLLLTGAFRLWYVVQYAPQL